jgi:hypothetical protein
MPGELRHRFVPAVSPYLAMSVGVSSASQHDAIALAQQKFFIYVAILPKPVVSVAHAVYVTSLRPTIPKRIRPMHISRSAVA